MLSHQDRALIHQAGNAFLRQFTAKVQGLPHRDVTTTTYLDWMHMYVSGLQRFHDDVLNATNPAVAALAPEERKARRQQVALSTLTAVRRELDAVLLSSVFATAWTDVYIPPAELPLASLMEGEESGGDDGRQGMNSETSEKEEQEAWPRDGAASSSSSWWHVPSFPAPGLWWSSIQGRNPQQQHPYRKGAALTSAPHSLESPTLELCSPEFMTEPLLGGETLRVYLDMIKRLRLEAEEEPLLEWNAMWHERRQRPPQTTKSSSKEDDDGEESSPGVSSTRGPQGSPRNSIPSPATRLLIPFSTLWILKAEAFGRTGSVVVASPLEARGSSVGGPHDDDGGGSATVALSFQERQARQRVLQSLHFSLQLTRMLLNEKPSTAPFAAPLLHIMTPTEEFDAICQLPKLRPHLPPWVSASEHDGKPAAGPTRSPASLTMEEVCEQKSSRLSYLAQALPLLLPRSTPRPTATKASQEEEMDHGGLTAPGAAVVLAPSHLHSTYRRARATFVRSSALTVRAMGDLLDHLTAASALESTGGDRPSRRPLGVHAETVKGCKEVARRLSAREENVRQALTLK